MVGGFEIRDLDFVVEGNALKVAKAAAESAKAKILSADENRKSVEMRFPGGVTDCLLQRGTRHVIAVDVAYGELHWKIREDERVTVIERKNVRELVPGDLEYAPDLIVADLSFIALEKVLPALKAVAAREFDFLALVKPQFEVGREKISKGGVVRDPEARIDAIEHAAQAAIDAGFSVQGACSSGLPGPAGNREAFLWLAEPERPGVADLHAAERAG